MSEGCRILLVEDSRTQAEELADVLQREGYLTVWAPDAETALGEVARGLPDLIVVDYYLPGMRGDELCRRLRMNVDARSVPILMLTADATHAMELRGLESGADDHVAKSVDRDILLLRLRALLRKSQAHASILGRPEQFLSRARLLAVDDSPTYLEYLAEELRGEGYALERVTCGREGLERMAAEPFDCVLVDLVMPDMDGIEVCRRVNEMRRAMDNPILVLMLTAYESKEDMTRGLAAGADDFVGKSSDTAVLKARIRALLRRKFFQEENRRILEELKSKELEAVLARAEKDAAEARAALAGQLEDANRKLQETQMHLIHSEKMASLGQLVAGIAHEMNNPLAFVLNNLFTVEEGLAQAGAGVPQKTRERLRETRQGIERICGLVASLRTFSRLDRGELTTADIHDSIESVLLFLRHRIEGRIEIERDYAPDGALECYAGQLNQVVMNLVSNAVDAIQDRGRITIATRRCPDAFLISVRDTGCGIPAAIRHRIFEPFFTTKPPGRGVGLGLSISYGIVQNHGGSIEFRSEEGRGTEFTVRIPACLPGGSKS